MCSLKFLLLECELFKYRVNGKAISIRPGALKRVVKYEFSFSNTFSPLAPLPISQTERTQWILFFDRVSVVCQPLGVRTSLDVASGLATSAPGLISSLTPTGPRPVGSPRSAQTLTPSHPFHGSSHCWSPFP